MPYRSKITRAPPLHHADTTTDLATRRANFVALRTALVLVANCGICFNGAKTDAVVWIVGLFLVMFDGDRAATFCGK